MDTEFEPKIVAFLCNWCSYAGADLAGTSRLQYPPNIRVIRVPCSGRINPIYIIKALLDGADGVLVSGCHPGDCHYLTGNFYARRKFIVFKKLLDVVGIERDRVHFTWVSASEGGRFAQVIQEVTDGVKKIGPNNIIKREVGADEFNIHKKIYLKDLLNRSCDFQSQNEEIRALCKKLLEDKTVDAVLATTPGLEGAQIPFFTSDPEEVPLIEWGNGAVQNLAPYLHGRKDKVAILAKPCDVRAIVQYIIERQLSRENVYIIGIDCAGKIMSDGSARPGCAECTVRTPPVFDALIRDERAGFSAVKEELPNNLARFQNEIDKCILCYSCRQACYGCYCGTCFIQRDTPDWQPSDISTGTKMTFHLGRAMHLAGRCVECGSCEAACASGVNIRYIIKEATDLIDELYGYRTGLDFETAPALLAYTFDDKEVGFFGREGNQ